MRHDRIGVIARAALIAILVVLLAVTPLSAIFRPAYFEALFPAEGIAVPLRVVLDDRTGLAAGFGPVEAVRSGDGVENPAGNRRALIVSISGGCGDHQTWLTFDRSDDGFRIEARTSRWGCGFLILLTRDVVIHLRAPVDASTVEFESLN